VLFCILTCYITLLSISVKVFGLINTDSRIFSHNFLNGDVIVSRGHSFTLFLSHSRFDVQKYFCQCVVTKLNALSACDNHFHSVTTFR